MNVPFVDVGTDEKLVLTLCPAHGCFIADFVCLLRRDLTGRKRLPDLKEQSPALHGPARFRLVLAFGQKKLSGGRCRIAEVGRHSSYLFRIEPIGKPILHRLNSRLPRRYFVGPDIGCSDSRSSFLKKMAAVLQPPNNFVKIILRGNSSKHHSKYPILKRF